MGAIKFDPDPPVAGSTVTVTATLKAEDAAEHLTLSVWGGGVSGSGDTGRGGDCSVQGTAGAADEEIHAEAKFENPNSWQPPERVDKTIAKSS